MKFILDVRSRFTIDTELTEEELTNKLFDEGIVPTRIENSSEYKVEEHKLSILTLPIND